MVRDKAAAPKINNLDFAAGVAPDQDVLWLQVAMDQTEIVHKLKPLQTLAGNLLEPGQCEVAFRSALSIKLCKLIEVVPEQLCDDE